LPNDAPGKLFLFTQNVIAYLYEDLFTKGALEPLTNVKIKSGTPVMFIKRSVVGDETSDNKPKFMFAIWVFLHDGRPYFVYADETSKNFVTRVASGSAIIDTFDSRKV
jgi:hypothetical protein